MVSVSVTMFVIVAVDRAVMVAVSVWYTISVVTTVSVESRTSVVERVRWSVTVSVKCLVVVCETMWVVKAV